jgi:hypothetical protein
MPRIAGRIAASLGLLSAWLSLLLLGWTAAGAIHLLLVSAVALFPWRELGPADVAADQVAAAQVPAAQVPAAQVPAAHLPGPDEVGAPCAAAERDREVSD